MARGCGLISAKSGIDFELARVPGVAGNAGRPFVGVLMGSSTVRARTPILRNRPLPITENRPPGDRPRPRLAYSDPARELAHLLARGASIGRIAAGHHFRGGQLLVGLLRTLRAVVRVLETQQQRAGTRMKHP